MPTKPSYSTAKPKGVSQAIDNFVTVGKTEAPQPKPSAPKRNNRVSPERKEPDDTVVQTTIRLSARLHHATRMLCLERGTTLNELVVTYLLHVAKAERESD